MDYYKVLGIEKAASNNEIKNAFKKKAMQYHPDKGGDADAFKKINEAYQVLSDPEKRNQYDQYGNIDNNQHRFTSQNFNNQDFESIFENFGFNINFGNGFQQRTQKNRDIKLTYQIDFADIFTGKTDTIVYKLPNGTEEIIMLQIPVGIRAGNTIKFQGQGDNIDRSLPRGDLLVQIHVRDQTKYRIQGDDIYLPIYLNIFDLLLGKIHQLDTPEGKTINLNIPRGTNPQTKFTIPQHGLPCINRSHRGQLVVEIMCSVPTLTDVQAVQLENLLEKF